MMKKIFTFIVLICFTAVSLTATIYALDEDCGCVIDCSCGVDCCCDDDCACKAECTCPITVCSVCDAIVKRRESHSQAAIASAFVINISFPAVVDTDLKSAPLHVYTFNVVEDNVRMNN
jgi:hypothetical protein